MAFTFNNRPTQDLMLDGITEMPNTFLTAGAQAYLYRSDNAEATRRAIEKFNYPKLGTRVQYKRRSKKIRMWYDDAHAEQVGYIIGYTQSAQGRYDGDYGVVLAYFGKTTKERVNSNEGYVVVECFDYEHLPVTDLVLDDGRFLEDVRRIGAPIMGKCKYCARQDWAANLKINLGSCTSGKCVLRAMRDHA